MEPANKFTKLEPPTDSLSSSGEFDRVVFLPDGRLIAVTSRGEVMAWDVASRAKLYELWAPNRRIDTMDLSPNGKLLIVTSSSPSSSWEGTLWDTTTKEQLYTLKSSSDKVSNIMFSPDSKLLAIVSKRKIIFWVTATGKLLHRLQSSLGKFSIMIFSPDSKMLATAEGGRVIIWDTATGEQLRGIWGYFDTIDTIIFSPDSKMLATAEGGRVIIWDTATGEQLRGIWGYVGTIDTIIFSPDSKMLTIAEGGRVIIWDTATGEQLRGIWGYFDKIDTIIFSPDSKKLATAEGGRVIIWDTATGERLHRIRGYFDKIDTIIFSPDSKMLAIAEGGQVTIWDIVTREQLYRPQSSSGKVRLIAFSPDSKLLALAALGDLAVRFWDIATADELKMLKGHRETIHSISDTLTLSLRQKKLIVELAAQLFDTLKSFELDTGTFERISKMLPDLLSAFAFQIGYRAQNSMYGDVSFFVHKHCRLIQASFENIFATKNIASSEVDEMQSKNFKMSRHLENPDLDPYQQIIAPDGSDKSIENNTESTPDASVYLDFILNTSAYSWLVASLQREMVLTRATPDLMEDIKEKILCTFPPSDDVSRMAPSQEYKATFELDWDPLLFVKEQQYTERPDQALERAITITGSANDAQAMTPGEYLTQTWPATGKHVMRLLTNIARDTIDHHATFKLPDGTGIDARIDGGKFIVTAVGTGNSLAEIGQQFAWLGAALRSSRFEAGVATCSPLIRIKNPVSLNKVSEQMPLAEIFCVIEFETDKLTASKERLPPGQCWHNMFRNPVMVSGYPVLTKREPKLGLEMPLNMIGELAGSERAIEFDGKVFIKGFSTMLIATKVTKELLIWHYFYNSEGERISYLDHTLQGVNDISLLQLESSRHVVGWCSECMYYAGAADARYNIGRTGLPRPHAGCILEKVSISGGKIITGGVTLAVGVKDIPPHLTRNGYIPKLRWIATKYVVLWDEADKRGWLVNGISALLHLVRASLKHYSTDDFSFAFLLDPDKLNDIAEHKPNSAHKVLVDDDNKELEIYPGRSERSEEEEETNLKGADTKESKIRKKKKRGYFLFEDLVEQHYNTLEQIMDHHRHVAGQNGVNLKARLRKHLEGWDFVELATDHDPYPRVATLQALGYGWVDFIRSIDAITLFGRGFGDIIRPIEFEGMCPRWKSLQTQNYYLAASVFDLKNIIEKFGDERANPLRPVHDLLWHCPGDLVTPCPCQNHGVRQSIRRALKQHHDPVQVFYPRGSRLILPIRGPDRLIEGGAVVFGHNIAWGYRWRENGSEDLEEGALYPSLQESENQIMTDTTGSSSRSSSQQVGKSIAHRISQRRESETGSITSSSPSASADSTPAESMVDSAQALGSIKPDTVNVTPEPSQQNVVDENKSRILRRERRRL